MRRPFLIAAFALFLAVPLWAQRGGGHAGGGRAGGFSGHGGGFSGHSGFSSGHAGAGHVGGGHFSGGMHRSPGFSRGFSHRQRGFSSRGFRGRRGPIITNFRSNHRRCGNCRGFGWGWGYPWWYSGYYDSYWWSDHGPSYDEDYERNRQIAAEMNEQNLEEMRILRQQDAEGDQDLYARSSPQGADPPESKAAAIMPATVLVFRDQHQQEVENYAIVGQTLWNVSAQRKQKIPLADLDLQATVKANDDRGVSFKVPTPPEGQ